MSIHVIQGDRPERWEHANAVGSWGARGGRCCGRCRESTARGYLEKNVVVKRNIHEKGKITRRHRQSRCPSRPCGPSCDGAGSKQRRSAARSLQHHTRMLGRVRIISKMGLYAKLTLLAGVAVHMRLQGRGTRETLVADLALVLFLSVGGHLGAELAHHGLRARGSTASQKAGWSGECARLV
jgi:hypothetical protein